LKVGSDIFSDMSDTDLELLARYTRQHAEEAFAEIVRRHLGLVYSAALRQVRSPQLAEEVAQSVFTDLSRSAARLKPDTILTAWLYQVTRRTAIDVVRREASRQLREQIATEMNAMNATAADWTHIEPLLDEAMQALEETDRTAVLLRYFENKSLREVGATLGTSENAAQKRLGRAVERLREFFAKRGVTDGASGLVVVISAHAVQAAPIALAAKISTAAVLGGAILAAATTETATEAIAMTVTQKVLITTVLTAAIGTGLYEARQASILRTQVQTLQQQQAPLTEEIQQLRRERDETVRELALLRVENERLNRNAGELIRLRAEAARLRNVSMPSANSTAGATENSTELAAKSWLARVNTLREHLKNNPDAWIPECQFLTDQDWLNASNGPLDKDNSLRRAMSSLRQAGKNKFVAMTLSALKRFAQTNGGEFPASLDQLKPFFNPPMDDSILDRYEILPLKNLPVASLSGKWAIAEKAPVDAAYDSRGVIGAQGFLFTDFRPFPIDKRLWLPYQEFRASNPGVNPTEPAQLLPYATTQEQRTAIQQAEAFLRQNQNGP
jgi:RNA polymerase sigma factor (sigma-70 family)